MPVQENFTEKHWIGRNYRIIRDFYGQEDWQVKEKTGISKQNLSTWANGNGNPGRKFIDQLSKHFGLPQEVFYKRDLSTEYLKTMKNNTDEKKGSDNTVKPIKDKADVEALRNALDHNSAYRIVPTSILEGKYTLISEADQQEKKDLLWVSLHTKDELIAELKQEITDLRAERERLLKTPPQKTK